MSYYEKWDPQENFYYASKNCGFISNSERTDGTYSKYSSIDDKLDNFHYFICISNPNAWSIRNPDLVLACEEDWCN